MKHHVNHPTEKKFLLPLTLSVLAVAGGGLFFSLNHEPVTKPASVHSLETVTESVLETNFVAAASAQTEFADTISESVIQSEFTPIITTEVTTQPESLPVTVPASSSTITTTVVTPLPTETELLTLPAEETITESETSVSTESTFSETSMETFTETFSEPVSLKPSYRDVLNSIFYTQSFQGDTFTLLNESDISENEFAVYDIDLDGSDELILRWSNTDMASVAGVIYGYDNQGNICRKLLTTPYLRFYSNGIIEADAAHNSALAGSFWAYTLYQYNSESNSYQEIAFVDAWDKSVSEINWDSHLPFPDEADKSHSGFVYYIYPFDSDSTDPLDIIEYQTWHISYIGGASELNLPFRKLTEANINEIP